MKTWKISKGFFLLFALILTSTHLFAAPLKPPLAANAKKAKPPTIKALLKTGSEGILLEARGAFAVFNPENGKKLSSGSGGKRFYLYPHEEGIKWGEDFPGIFQIKLVPTGAKTTFLIDGIQYRGTLEIYHVEGALNIVNEVDVETFLKATLIEKTPLELPLNVLDALVITARTTAYYTALLNHTCFYHFDAKKWGYRGVGLTKQNLPIERAIKRTAHIVMTYRRQPFPATWTEHSAGKTASYSEIFRKNTPTPPGVDLELALSNRNDTHWSFICEAQELAQKVELNRITSIDLFTDSTSSKAYGLRIRDGNYTKELNFKQLQKMLGKNRLKSNDFTVSVQGNLLSFKGHGEGLGTGLCLYTAKYLAARGESVPNLLTTFFPHTDLEKMNTYPKMIISSDQNTFVSPKQQPKTLNQ